MMPGVPRRGFSGGLAGAGLAVAAGAAGVLGLLAFLWPRRSSGQFDAGRVADYPVGTVRHFQVRESGVQVPPAPLGEVSATGFRDFHLVRRPDGFVAFWHRCTHRGCTVPYRPDFEMPNVFGADGRPVDRGLFRCPCHGSTFSRDEGEAIFGPAPRPLDTLPVQIKRGRVLVTVLPGSERRRSSRRPPRVAAA